MYMCVMDMVEGDVFSRIMKLTIPRRILEETEEYIFIYIEKYVKY
jgi:hypothetical protein